MDDVWVRVHELVPHSSAAVRMSLASIFVCLFFVVVFLYLGIVVLSIRTLHFVIHTILKSLIWIQSLWFLSGCLNVWNTCQNAPTTKPKRPPHQNAPTFFSEWKLFYPHFFIAKNGTFNIFVLLNVVVCLYRFVPPLEWCRHASIFHMYVNW